MKQPSTENSDRGDLRRRAELAARLLPAPSADAAGRDHTARMVHELQVHQIELEMQNAELEEARHNLAAALERAVELFDFAPHGYVAVLADGTIREANLTFAALLRLDRSEIAGQRLQSYIAPAGRGVLEETLARAFATAVTQSCEVALAARTAPTAILRVSAVPAREGRECLVVLEDITALRAAEHERKQVEAKMLEAQKLECLGVLAGGMAHDFNNLLMGILGHAHLALQDLPPDGQPHASVREIERAARHSADLCRQMLAYAGRGRFVTEPVNVSALAVEVSTLLHSAIPRQATLRFQCDDSVPLVEGDPALLQQVVMNLVINGAEALGSGEGEVRIATSARECTAAFLQACTIAEASAPGLYVCIEVSDTGCGMDAATVARIFDPFFTTKFTGRGLGLAAVQGIIRRHLGAVRVESTPGQGTTFQVFLPASPNQTAPEPAPVRRRSQAEFWHSSGTLLLADDSESVRTSAARLIERWGFKVFTARDGAETVELFRKHAADIRCVVLDQTIPRLGGEEVFRAIRQIRPDAKVIVATGMGDPVEISRMRRQGLSGVIAKPFAPEELNDLLREVLNEARPA